MSLSIKTNHKIVLASRPDGAPTPKNFHIEKS